MPHRANDRIAAEIVDQGWFQSQTKEGLPSDNWRIVQDAEGRKALLYLVRFMSASGEPQRIPNNRNALRCLYQLNRDLPSLETGPFLALAEVSDSTASPAILAIYAWDISACLPSPWVTLKVMELGGPIFQTGRPRSYQYPIVSPAGHQVAEREPSVQPNGTLDGEQVPGYDEAAIRELLRDLFGTQDLRQFCQDRARFHPILRYLGPEFKTEDLIDVVIEYCQLWHLLPELLSQVREFNPTEYSRYQDKLREKR
jgi:hypothetical protein